MARHAAATVFVAEGGVPRTTGSVGISCDGDWLLLLLSFFLFYFFFFSSPPPIVL